MNDKLGTMLYRTGIGIVRRVKALTSPRSSCIRRDAWRSSDRMRGKTRLMDIITGKKRPTMARCISTAATISQSREASIAFWIGRSSEAHRFESHCLGQSMLA